MIFTVLEPLPPFLIKQKLIDREEGAGGSWRGERKGA